MTWCILFIYLLLSLNCQETSHLQGSLGDYAPHKTLMVYDHSVCLSSMQHISLKQTIMYTFLCIQNMLTHCLVKKPVGYSETIQNNLLKLRNSSYCGSIWLKDKPRISLNKHILLQVRRALNIRLNFLHFHFYLTKYVLCHQHGLVISFTKFQSVNYCGLRIPWNVIVNNHQIYLQLVLEEFKDYHLQLYYSGFQNNWISNVAKITSIYQDTSFLNHIIPSFIFFYESYEWYVMSHQENYFEIEMELINTQRLKLIIHDGPGPLSPIIKDIKNRTTSGIERSQTSAFWTYIKIKTSNVNLNLSVYIGIIAVNHANNKQKTDSCSTITYQKGVIESRSRYMKNILCMKTTDISPFYAMMYIKRFRFYGPNMMVQFSDSECQYGGLTIQFGGRKQQFGFCDGLDNHVIRSSHRSFTFIVVWFFGYSSGYITAYLQKSLCQFFYSEFYLSKARLLLPHLLHKPTSLYSCGYVVSPALQNQYQRRFVVGLGPPSMGAAGIKVVKANTLIACDPYFFQVKTDNNLTIHIKSVSFENWPLTLAPSVSHYLYKMTDTITLSFDYLHTASVSLPYICEPGRTRTQLAVLINISNCFHHKSLDRIYPLVHNNIPSLGYNCRTTVYDFTPTAKGSKGYTNFIYKDNSYNHSGHEVSVTYLKCPLECRHYRYSTFVRSVDQTTVLEYTANVGQPTDTGSYHRGFRVEILTPNPVCDKHHKCQLELRISWSQYRPSLIHMKTTLPSTYHFHSKR